MNMSLRYPNITGRTEREQLAQVNSYLRQMVDQLNFALQGQGSTGKAGADGKDGKNGADGKNGSDGKTPQKGVDYWTDADVKQIVDAAVQGVLKEKVKILEASMPVGYLYASNSPTEPKTLFGFGTWERIKDRFPLAAGSTYAAGSTGGKATHTLTVDEMPSHNHTLNNISWGGNVDSTPNQNCNHLVYDTNNSAVVSSHYFNKTGGSQPHNNMPPYYAMYMWIRTA